MFSRLLGRTSKTTQVRKPNSYKSCLRLEALEGREVPAVFTVNTLGDGLVGEGQVTLRSAIENANLQATGVNTPHEITFAANLTNQPFFSIALSRDRGSITFSQPITIIGPGADKMEIVGDGNATTSLTLFVIPKTNPPPPPEPGEPPQPQFLLPVTFKDVSVANGYSTADGGAVRNGGKLTLERCTFRNNETTKNGGAIVSDTDTELNIKGCKFSNNKATLEGGAIELKDRAVMNIDSAVAMPNGGGGGPGPVVTTAERIPGQPPGQPLATPANHRPRSTRSSRSTRPTAVVRSRLRV